MILDTENGCLYNLAYCSEASVTGSPSEGWILTLKMVDRTDPISVPLEGLWNDAEIEYVLDHIASAWVQPGARKTWSDLLNNARSDHNRRNSPRRA